MTSQVADLERDIARVGIQRQVFVRRLNGVGVVVDAEHLRGAERARGDREDSGAGAHVEHDPLRAASIRCERRRHSRVVA